MSAAPTNPTGTVPTGAPPGELAGGVLGLPSVLFCIVTGAAPLAAMLFNVPVATLGGGYASPAAFLVATIALTIFSVGYIAMARRVTSAGGFYTFISRGLGRVAGLGAGYLIALCYIIFSAAVLGVTSYFASTTVATITGIDLPAWLYMIIGLVLVSLFAWFHIELTAKVLGVLLIGEVLVLAVMAVGIFAVGGAEGLSLAPLNPVNIFDNSAAVEVFGGGAAGIALFGAFWSWVGFEMAPNYAEETRDPHKIAKTATYGSVIGLGVFYVIMSYAFVTGWGLTGSANAVKSQYAGEIASAFYPLTDRYVGSWLTAADGDPHRDRLVRLHDVVLQHRRPLPVRDGPRRGAACLARSYLQAAQPDHRVDDRHRDRRALLPGVRDLRPQHRGRAAQARHLVAAARRAGHPRGAGARVDRDHPVLPHLRAGRLPLVDHAGGPGDRLPRDGDGLRAARGQPRRPLRRGRRRLHRDPPLGGTRHLRHRDGGGRLPPQQRPGPLHPHRAVRAQ